MDVLNHGGEAIGESQRISLNAALVCAVHSSPAVILVASCV